MKNRILTLVFAALCLCADVVNSSAQTTAGNQTLLTSLTNLPTFVVGGGQSNITSYTSQTVDLIQGKGLGVTAYVAGTNALTVESQTLSVALSYDGTNYQTTNFLTLVFPGPGAGAQRASTNFGTALVGSYRKARIAHYKNGADATNRVFLTNIVFHVDN